MTRMLEKQEVLNHNYSYQHIQGSMLLNLNKLASNLKLSHTEYRLMGTLIGLYNKGYGKAFPTIEYLANTCNMGKSTILKALNKFVALNLLVVVKTPGKRNNYYFSNLILTLSGTPHVEPQRSTPCSTTHDNKQIKNKTNREQTLGHEEQKFNNLKDNNDDDFNNNKTDLIEYKQVLGQLDKWHFTGAKLAIKTNGIQKIKNLIEVVKTKNPDNKGAYLRSLLHSGYTNIPEEKKESFKTPLNEGLESVKKVLRINDKRLSREEIICTLVKEGREEEVKILRNLWKF